MTGALNGRRIAVPESRELDLFSRMLEERGANTFRCPLVSIVDAADQKAVTAWLRRFIDDPPTLLILLTGEGLRRLLAAAERGGVREAFIKALAGVRTLTRGPKPGRALREINLKPSLAAVAPTTEGIIETLPRIPLEGCRVGVQLYGQEPNEPLIRALRAARAKPDVVMPYQYVRDTDDPRVLQLIDGLSADHLDAIAFTSKAQVSRLFSVAAAHGQTDDLRAGLERTVVAAVGPVVTRVLEEHGVATDLQPEQSFFMKPLVRELESRFGGPDDNT